MNFNKVELEKRINELAIEIWTIKLTDMLAWWVVSDVYSAELETIEWENKQIVVKYTKENISLWTIFSEKDRDYSFADIQATHELDMDIQKILNVKTPKIIKHFSEDNITLMENFANEDYKLLQGCIIDWELPFEASKNLWESLATVRYDLEVNWSNFKQVEDSGHQFDERFFELQALLYNWRMDKFNKIKEDFVAKNRNWVMWTDWDQKNFAVKPNGEVMVFDFGRSVICDPDFLLPNLLGHLGLFTIAWYIENPIEFLKSIQESFMRKYKFFNSDHIFNEQKFINYFTASLIHRGMAMRWIDTRIANNIWEDSMKWACMAFWDEVFDKENPVESIEELFSILETIRSLAEQGKYKRPKVR